MIIPPVLIQKYGVYQPLIILTAEKAKETLLNYCDQKGYAFVSRIKTIESLVEKIETGRFKNWSAIDDLFACAIIIPTLAQEKEVVKFCRSAFNFKGMTNRGQVKKAPDVFRFDSPRIHVQLPKPNGLVVAEHPTIYDITFEIQIRTAFEHAWIVATHDLVYKGSDIDWKRQRLAAQIKATVEQLDTLILAFEYAFPYIPENPWPETKAKQKIISCLKRLIEQGHIPSECLPKDLSRFCDNLHALLQNVGLGEELASVLEIIEKELSQTSNEMFPRSISLLQYFLAILISNGSIVPPVSGYCSHITEGLLQLYPKLQVINLRFDYDA